MSWPYLSARAKLGIVLCGSTCISLGFYMVDLWRGSNSLSYLPWNLMLAWISLLVALWLERTISREVWSSWYALSVTLLWLILLPNAFYMLSDFVHIQDLDKTNLLYDSTMFISFIVNGFILGLLSLFIIHWELKKRISGRLAAAFIGSILLICSFAIYVGRDLRWNAWDIIVNPASVLFDVSDRLINAEHHPEMFVTTLSFFVLITSVYATLWFAARVARQQRDNQ